VTQDSDTDSQPEESTSGPKTPWATSVEQVLAAVGVDPTDGLDAGEAADRLETHGPNALRDAKQKSAWTILVRQFKSIIIGLLIAAAVVAFMFGETIEMIAIAVVVVFNTGIGFATELRAVRSMEALRQMAEVAVRVRRDGQIIEIPARQLVPGDIVVLESGDLVPADLRVTTSTDMEVDESVLTGESVPVGKETEAVDAGVVLAERQNMLYRGTSVTRGRGEAVVVGTGMETEVGRISELVQEAGDRETPLEERLDSLGRQLVGICVGLAAAVGGVGVYQGKELFTVIETSIALAVATIPEGLPIVATIALARGVWRMADRNALVRNLAVVERLGSTTRILTDKTGTLTENEMTVAEYRDLERQLDADSAEDDDQDEPIADDSWGRKLLEIGVLCNDEHLGQAGVEETRVGEPMEMALLNVAANAGLDPEEVRGSWPRIDEEPFDSTTKMMATFHQSAAQGGESSGQVRTAVKGAPEAVIDHASQVLTESAQRVELTDKQRDDWRALNRQMAEDGLRVLALAERTTSGDERPEAAYQDLTLVGLVGMVDPPRADVRGALDACKHAGIRVVMVTGDQPGTALYVARELSLTEDPEATAVHGSELGEFDHLDETRSQQLRETSVFSRVSPEQKLRLVELHQAAGEVVAMTSMTRRRSCRPTSELRWASAAPRWRARRLTWCWAMTNSAPLWRRSNRAV
jgi:Ca2+-transporting ATPase